VSRRCSALAVAALVLPVFGAVPARATLRTAAFEWTPASGPVEGYVVYLSVGGAPEDHYATVDEPSAWIEFESGASVQVSVAAFDAAGRLGPRSDASAPLRLCPGDFNGNERIENADVLAGYHCFGRASAGDCAAADFDSDGWVSTLDVGRLKPGPACETSPPAAFCPGDLDGDGEIGTYDFALFRGCFNQPVEPGCAAADFNGDGWINTFDLKRFGNVIGSGVCMNQP
jgi:hypothetical protein